MRLFLVSATLAFLGLALVPSASAVGEIADPTTILDRPCIIYPGYYQVVGGYYGTRDTTVQGRDVDVFFVHASTDDVTVTGTGVYVNPVYVQTPGICWDSLIVTA